MGKKTIRMQVIILFLLILINFFAQIPYYLHLYYNPNDLLASARGIVLMFFVFAVFLLASLLLFKQRTSGYWLMVFFVAVEFLFYLWNSVIEVMSGNGLFFHLNNPDLLLRAIFAIGYVNLFASGYFLALLLLKKSQLLAPQERAKPAAKYKNTSTTPL
jgi:hypothetical protein